MNKPWHIFAMIVILNKEFCVDEHTEIYYNNLNNEELRYLCRVFTNKFCKKGCRSCGYFDSKYLDQCIVFESLKKVRDLIEW